MINHDEKSQQREAVYQIYESLGPLRSAVRLERVLREKHPDLRVSVPTLSKWSKQQGWEARALKHDASAPAPAQPTKADAVADDPIAALLDLTYKTLARALEAAPTVTRPNEVKSLIDSATTALKLAEQIKASQTSKTTAEDVGAETLRVINLIHTKRREDALTLAIDILHEQGADASKLETELREIQEEQAVAG